MSGAGAPARRVAAVRERELPEPAVSPAGDVASQAEVAAADDISAAAALWGAAARRHLWPPAAPPQPGLVAAAAPPPTVGCCQVAAAARRPCIRAPTTLRRRDATAARPDGPERRRQHARRRRRRRRQHARRRRRRRHAQPRHAATPLGHAEAPFTPIQHSSARSLQDGPSPGPAPPTSTSRSAEGFDAETWEELAPLVCGAALLLSQTGGVVLGATALLRRVLPPSSCGASSGRSPPEPIAPA